MSSEPQNSLPQKEAEHLIRLFNVVFNSAMLYGGTHPTTIKSIGPFFQGLTQALTTVELTSLVIDRESLFVDEWPVEKVVNPRRILQQFGKIGIVSITFDRGITEKGIELLLQYVGDSNTITPVDQVEKHLKDSGVKGIRLNYIRYGRITNDQAVVDASQAGNQDGGTGTGIGTSLSPESIKQLEEVLSLAKFFENPESSASAFSQVALNPDHSDDAVRSLSDLRQSIHYENAPSIDLLLNAVFELKVDLSEAISVQRETGKLLSSSEPVVEEMDGLTCDVIVKLVREEYGTGEVPIRRLAEIIKRMLPSSEELKRLLPKLKPALLEAGMSLTDYLQLIRTLNIDFKSESLADSLEHAASGIGASVEELVRAIQSQPDDAARLLVMASEIRKGTKEDEAQLSSMLTDYIEKVSTSLALESRELSIESGSCTLQHILGKLEQQLLDNLKKYGLEQPVLNQVGSLLAKRRESIFDNATAEWITSELKAKPDLTGKELSEQLVHMVSEQSQLDRLHEPVMAALTKRGFDKDQMQEMLKKIAARIETGKMFKLPPGVLSSNNMQFLLDREIKQHHRYQTPFSSIIITTEGLRCDGTARPPTDDEQKIILPKLFSVAKIIFRDIDLIGALPEPDDKVIFSLLGMTDEKGAHIARIRFLKRVASLHFKTKEGDAEILVAASVTAPEPEKKYDLKSYLAFAHEHHETAVKELHENHHL